MKLHTITQTNAKGQLVIPQSIRKALNITAQTPLNVWITGKSVTIQPIETYTPTSDSQDSYLEILKKTQGAWSDLPVDNQDSKQTLELEASQERKQPW